jgi:glyceraldehyde 3-phosphate dehydrogenase
MLDRYAAYQFKYDSVHGRYPGEVKWDKAGLIIDGKHIAVFQQ